MKITILIPEKVSLNKIYAGIHFRERAGHKQEYAWAVQSADVKPWDGAFPVHVHYHFSLNGTALDISNHAYMLKMVEDGLVACGVFPDDNPKYIAGITTTGERIKEGYDTVEVTITPCVLSS